MASLYPSMAFAKTLKRIRITVLSANFKIRLKYQVKKSHKFPMSCPTTPFCRSCKLSGIEPGFTAYLPTNLTNKPDTQVKKCYLYMSGIEPGFNAYLPTTLTTLRWKNAIFTCIWSHSVQQNGELRLSFSNGRNSISRYFFSQNPKCRFFLFQYTNFYLCA